MITGPLPRSPNSAFSVYQPKEAVHSRAPRTAPPRPTDKPSSPSNLRETTTAVVNEEFKVKTLQKLLTGEYGDQRKATAFTVLNIKESDVEGILSLDDSAKKATLCMKVLYAELITKSSADWAQWRKDNPDLVLKEEMRKYEDHFADSLLCNEIL